jgi:hypothetical protein
MKSKRDSFFAKQKYVNEVVDLELHPVMEMSCDADRSKYPFFIRKTQNRENFAERILPGSISGGCSFLLMQAPTTRNRASRGF